MTIDARLRLYGRDLERAEIDRLLERSRRSHSGVLVLRADPGMGKSALLEYARSRAQDLTVLEVVGMEPEIDLPYAALHRLLQPALPFLDRIPEVQADALRCALALAPGTADNRFAVALAVLNLIAETAAEGPMLCLVDDAQWLDRPSADALAFAGRRLAGEGVVLLIALRTTAADTFPGAGLATHDLAGLEQPDADRFLADRHGPELAEGVRRAIRIAAGGNPLALLEIPRALTPEQLAGTTALPTPMPLGSELERVLLDRVRRLPPSTQTLLLVAAAEGAGDADVVIAASARMGVPASALQAAESAGVVRADGSSLVFSHPIMRTAVYQAAGLPQRRATHQALADVLTGEPDADRRAWHRAAMALHPDHDLADELEQTADRARRRRGFAAASAALRRAAELTPDIAPRARRSTLAARAAWDAGRADDATALLGLVETEAADLDTFAEVRHLQGEIALRCGVPAEGASLLRDGAARIADSDPRKALQLTLDAALCAIYAGEPAAVTASVEIARRLPAARLGTEAPLVDVLEAVAGIVLVERPAPPERLLHWLAGVAESNDPQALIWAGAAASGIGDVVRQRTLRRRAEAIARRSTAVGTLAMILERTAWMDMMAGQVVAAKAQAQEGLGLAVEAGMTNSVCFHRVILAWVAGVRGEEAECLALAGGATATAERHGLGPHHSIAQWAVGLSHLGQGRWDDAATCLAGMSDPGSGHPFVAMLALPDVVEAAVRAHRPDLARASADRFENYAGDGAPWQRALVARCRALVAPADARQRLLSEAQLLHEQDQRPFHRARTDLLLGEHLRRERRRAEARSHLLRAVETFERMGARPWEQRAMAELRATGARARRRTPEALTQLTPQQSQIMRLVADGASNREVAAQLFLSPRTVDYHLRNVFVKLGISSRNELIRLHGDAQANAGE